jgi:hypothetical protein
MALRADAKKHQVVILCLLLIFVTGGGSPAAFPRSQDRHHVLNEYICRLTIYLQMMHTGGLWR